MLATILDADMDTRNEHATDSPLRVAFDASFLSLPASGIGTYVRGLTEALIRRQYDLGFASMSQNPAESAARTSCIASCGCG